MISSNLEYKNNVYLWREFFLLLLHISLVDSDPYNINPVSSEELNWHLHLATLYSWFLWSNFSFAAFILLVIFRYFRQHVVQQLEDEEAQTGEKEEQQALLAAEPEEKEPQQALVVAEQECQS